MTNFTYKRQLTKNLLACAYTNALWNFYNPRNDKVRKTQRLTRLIEEMNEELYWDTSMTSSEVLEAIKELLHCATSWKELEEQEKEMEILNRFNNQIPTRRAA